MGKPVRVLMRCVVCVLGLRLLICGCFGFCWFWAGCLLVCVLVCSGFWIAVAWVFGFRVIVLGACGVGFGLLVFCWLFVVVFPVVLMW